MNFKDYKPKLLFCLKEGYTKETFFADLIAGVSVGIIALPLALAFAIGSGVSPEQGLFTAIVAGFLISFLGGSRVQIGGPTGAFVVIVYAIVQKYGYEGLAVATLLGGVMMILMGLARFGVLLKYIPFTVTTGFTTGIALVIFSSQIKDFFGLQVAEVPPQFIQKCTTLCCEAHTCNIWAAVVALCTLIAIFSLKRFFPKAPVVIIAIIAATLIAYLFQLPLETIESKFGQLPRMLPQPSFPKISYSMIKAVFPDAITIAMLGAIESLLSAVVADGMTGHRHRSNGELVAQGIANVGSVIFGGIPATGAIARTVANINIGAKTPVAGMIHAVTLLVLMLLFSPLAVKIPLCTLSAVLIYVAWNMSELGHFIEILKGDFSDALVLGLTFLLTVLIDLTVAVQVGVLLAALIFLKKMTDTTSVKVCQILVQENENEAPPKRDDDILLQSDIPKGVAVFEINGPFFYSVADQLSEALLRLEEKPCVFILRMHKVPIIDATGIKALKDFQKKCRQKNILFLVSEAEKLNTVEKIIEKEHLFTDVKSALTYINLTKSHRLSFS